MVFEFDDPQDDSRPVVEHINDQAKKIEELACKIRCSAKTGELSDDVFQWIDEINQLSIEIRLARSKIPEYLKNLEGIMAKPRKFRKGRH